MSDTMRRVTLGRVAGVFGIKGWVKIASNTRPAENLLGYPRWWIASSEKPGEGFEAKLVESRAQVNGIVAQITGRDGKPITDRDIAARLVGYSISVDHDQLPKAPEGSYYWADLIGLDVVTKEGEPLGAVTAMMENGAQDVLVIEQGEVERLIPFVHDAIIQSVDLALRRIVADWSPDW